jgi:pimeloyl-ACP methyl ester carboxylesterase
MDPQPRLRRPAAGDRPVRVLLLHGMGGGVGGWDPLDRLLAPELELWDVAMPWTTSGDVRWAYERDVTRWAEDLLDGVDVVMAHSFAANVVLELADRLGPDWRRPLVLLAPFYRQRPEDFDWSVMNHYVEGFRRMLDDGLRLRAGSRLDDEVRQDMAGRLCELMGPYTWLRFFDTFLRTPLLRPERLAVPTLLVGGERDPGALIGGVRQLAARVPLSRLAVLADCGHFPMAERPESLASHVNEFVTSLSISEFILERSS